MAALVNPHGGDLTFARARMGRAPLDFSANLNPLGLPAAVRAAAAEALEDSGAYPDPHCRALRAALALREGVDASRIRCGNGAADLIYRFAFAVRAENVLIPMPTFCEYALAFEASGSRTLRHQAHSDAGFALAEEVLPRLTDVQALCLCNPNNPTGLTVDPELLTDILDRSRTLHLPVLLDECFVDFLDEPDRHTKIGCLEAY
ncbi:MAG TPA: aminotransferase class I/II-fold pyridoxal phosphate-dependent enzyme, partial [Clostridia bacterium]|nr:aminotransferase class I/II-fold pyridoxal phosphate-dependent enzyme [Clostridia bacterium]